MGKVGLCQVFYVCGMNARHNLVELVQQVDALGHTWWSPSQVQPLSVVALTPRAVLVTTNLRHKHKNSERCQVTMYTPWSQPMGFL